MSDEPYTVELHCVKPSGVRVLFAKYRIRAAADAAARALRGHGLACEVVEASDTNATPGTTIGEAVREDDAA